MEQIFLSHLRVKKIVSLMSIWNITADVYPDSNLGLHLEMYLMS
jgi:hypothetical protein